MIRLANASGFQTATFETVTYPVEAGPRFDIAATADLYLGFRR